MSATVHAQCTLCEAHCGIRVEVQGAEVLRITGDPDDAMSRGYICPKGSALADLHNDPDRLRGPVKRVGERFVEISWAEAIDLAVEGLKGVQRRHGADAVATYIGNPGAHSAAVLAAGVVRKLLGSVNNYSATSTDQLPQHRVSAEMFGHFALLPVPDIDRTNHMLILGANPAVSNGSIMTAPGVRERLQAIRHRGGRVVVVDPRRTETANLADEHVPIRPGGDAYLLLGMLQTLFDEGLARAEDFDDIAALRALCAQWPVARAAEHSGVAADEIVRLAREFAAAPSAVAYGRAGVCQQLTGSVTHWLINALNLLTGNFDQAGGAMFTTPAVDVLALTERALGASGQSAAPGRQRLTGREAFMEELPVAGLADEMLTPGDGQVRGMFLYAGNPVLSTPGGHRLDEAMAELEFCVAVDMYVTETTRHAHVILPPVSHLERDDIDVVLSAFGVRNHIRYNPAALPAPADGRTDWQIMIALAARIGRGATGTAASGALRLLTPLLSGPDRAIDAAVRLGPYGALRGRSRQRGSLRGLSLAEVKRARHGIDLGPLEPRLPGVLRTPDQRIHLAPEPLLAAARELEEIAGASEAARRDGFDLTLIGRRQLRSNNSWMHNCARLMKGPDRCTARLHPDDAAARGITTGSRVQVSSRVGQIQLPVELSDEMRPGVVSVPHGFGHHRAGVGWTLAAAHAGASVNDVTDPELVDRLTGNAAYNAVPVRVSALPADLPTGDRAARSLVEVPVASR